MAARPSPRPDPDAGSGGRSGAGATELPERGSGRLGPADPSCPAEEQGRGEEERRLFLTGVEALAHAPVLQRRRDAAAGLHTAGYVSGYRGSPLGGLDMALHEAQPLLAAHDVRFLPAVNEDLAATAIWGTQQLHLLPGARRDGIFAMWYGKGPGVDRCVDVFKHANHAGTSPHGGVLVVAGDDHAARSSAVAHQSEHVFSACGIPVLAPADVQDILDLALHGWAMSRYAGCWVALKLAADVVESSATVEVDAARVQPRTPEDWTLPPDGVHIRWPDPQAAQEQRMQATKIYAAAAYARANGLNRIVFDSPRARLGLVACGKAWLDLREALRELGIDAQRAAALGLRVWKVGMPWPLEADGARRFATGLEEILVVEEKRQIIEYQLKEMLYDWRDDVRPRIVGKFDDTGEWPAPHGPWLLPPTGDLTPMLVARAVRSRLARLGIALQRGHAPGDAAHAAVAGAAPAREAVANGAAAHDAAPHDAARAAADPTRTALPRTPARTPYFCSGCPHNRSTRVPEGSCAFAGVGCHLMATWMDRRTLTVSQMGGEGATWIGMAEHAGPPHVYANMGDGTYFHSGLLAIRAAVAAGVNITYKILYNDAVAMTGGQAVDGPLTVPRLTRQLAAEGVARIAVLSDDPARYPPGDDFPPGVRPQPRERLDAVQRELRDVPGVTVLVYDQVCATEARRRRKRGAHPPAKRHVFIHEAVCEGCGDCAAVSNCLSVVPVATEFGTRRRIDQASCNQDLACVDGRCPALVTVEGATVQRGTGLPPGDDEGLPEPALPDLAQPYALLLAGMGGTGIVTLGALIGTAAHLEGRGVTVLDQTGLAQKGGAVLTHVRIARRQDELHAPRIVQADVLLGADLLVAAGADALPRLRSDRTHAVIDTAEHVTGESLRDPTLVVPRQETLAVLRGAVRELDALDATRLATLLAGDPIATNLFVLGFAWQRGLVPVGRDALLRALQRHGVAVEDNRRAFAWGRRAALDRAAVERVAEAAERLPPGRRLARSLDEAVARRRAELVAYQDEALACRYEALVERVRAAERRVRPGSERLALAVARQAFRLYAYKDEYEVARLYADPAFAAGIADAFGTQCTWRPHFTLPWQRGAGAQAPRKRSFGPWVRPLLRLLARGKRLRGTRFDPFGRTEERRLERALAAQYEDTVDRLLRRLDAARLDAAVEIANLPETIRGFGDVKRRHAQAVAERQAALLAAYESDGPPASAGRVDVARAAATA